MFDINELNKLVELMPPKPPNKIARMNQATWEQLRPQVQNDSSTLFSPIFDGAVKSVYGMKVRIIDALPDGAVEVVEVVDLDELERRVLGKASEQLQSKRLFSFRTDNLV